MDTRPETLRMLLDTERESHRKNCDLLTEQRDLERTRFASWAQTFDGLLADIERQPSQWGHLRHRVAHELRAAAAAFRGYAPGQPSVQRFKERAQAAEAEVAVFQERLRRYEDADPAAATRDISHAALPGGAP